MRSRGTKMKKRPNSVISLGLAILLFVLLATHVVGVSSAESQSKKAIFLLPHRTEFGREFTYLQDYLRNDAGYEVTVKRDEEVSLAVLKTLGDYSVVFMNAHGNVKKNRFEFTTGMPMTAKARNDNAQDFEDGLLTKALYETGFLRWETRVGATSAYLKKYNDKFDDTLLYAQCCYSMTDGILAKDMMENGARGVIGFERLGFFRVGDDSGDNYDDRETKKFFDAITDDGNTVSRVFEDVYNSTPGMANEDDPWEVGPPCYGWALKAEGGESFCLVGSPGKLPEIPDAGAEEAVKNAIISGLQSQEPDVEMPYRVWVVTVLNGWAVGVIYIPGTTTVEFAYCEKKEGTWRLVARKNSSGLISGTFPSDAPTYVTKDILDIEKSDPAKSNYLITYTDNTYRLKRDGRVYKGSYSTTQEHGIRLKGDIDTVATPYGLCSIIIDGEQYTSTTYIEGGY